MRPSAARGANERQAGKGTGRIAEHGRRKRIGRSEKESVVIPKSVANVYLTGLIFFGTKFEGQKMRNPCLVQRVPPIPCWSRVPMETEILVRAIENPNHHNRDSILPTDPRLWSRAQVALWLENIAEKHSLPDVKPERFPMNGKALCLMTVDMFTSRVPVGGKLLYKDFHCRLAAAIHS